MNALVLLALLGCPKDKEDSGVLPDGGTPTGTEVTLPGGTPTGTTDVTTTERLDCAIAFFLQPGGTGERQVYLSPPDAQSPVQVSTIGVAPFGEPLFSPNGTMIAYGTEVENPDGNWPDGIAVAYHDGRTPEPFHWIVDSPDFAWTKDGTQLVLSGRTWDDSDYYDLYVWTPGTSPTNITQTASEWEELQDISPIDGKILFRNSLGLYTMSPAGGAATEVVATNQLSRAQYSPDGTQIAAIDDAVPDDVVQMDADGSNPGTIYQAPGLGVPLWSPDGSTIALLDDTGNAHVIQSTGTLVGVWALPADSRQITWGPNGTVLYAHSTTSGLHQVDPTTGAATLLRADARNVGVSPTCHGAN